MTPSELQKLAVPEARPGRVPTTDNIGMGLSPSPGLGKKENEIYETLQWNRGPSTHLSHYEGQTGGRPLWQRLQFKRCPVICANPSFVTQQSDCPSENSVRDGRASVLSIGDFGPTRMKGLIQTRQVGLVALPIFVPLVSPQLHRRIGVEQRLTIAAVLSLHIAGVLLVS